MLTGVISLCAASAEGKEGEKVEKKEDKRKADTKGGPKERRKQELKE